MKIAITLIDRAVGVIPDSPITQEGVRIGDNLKTAASFRAFHIALSHAVGVQIERIGTFPLSCGL